MNRVLLVLGMRKEQRDEAQDAKTYPFSAISFASLYVVRTLCHIFYHLASVFANRRGYLSVSNMQEH